MLDIYPITLLVARDASLAAPRIQRHDPDLARQLRKAAASVPLNTAEGAGNLGGHRKNRYAQALGSAREVGAIYDTAAAMGYLAEPAPEVRARLHHVIAVLVKVTR